MTIYTDFLPDKIIITILKFFPLPTDCKKQILEVLISDLMLDDTWWYNYIHEKPWWYADPEPYDDWLEVVNEN